MATVKKNKKFNSVEIVYKKKPCKKRRQLLSDNGYKWSPCFTLWYKSTTKIKNVPKEMIKANKLINQKL